MCWKTAAFYFQNKLYICTFFYSCFNLFAIDNIFNSMNVLFIYYFLNMLATVENLHFIYMCEYILYFKLIFTLYCLLIIIYCLIFCCI